MAKKIKFKVEIGIIFKDKKRDITITDREIRKDKHGWNLKWYKYHCNICTYEEGWIEEYDLIHGQGCSCCCGRTVVVGINDIPTVTPWLIPYFQGGYDEAKLYTKCGGGNPNNRYGRINPVCPDCGRIRDRSMLISQIYSSHSIGCSCRDGKSYCEKFMFSILEQLKIEFNMEYNPIWIKPRRYDFYISILNIVIEVNGEQHYNQQTRKGARNLTQEKANDKLKKEKALTNGILEENYIEIDCRHSTLDWIKEHILNSRLNELFDLSKIDWLKAEEFTCNNLVKIACEYKRDNLDWTTTKIGELMNLNKQTIMKYLKKGTKIWDWCNYDTKEEMRKNCSKNGKSLGKQVEIFKDGISLGIFESTMELERQSEKLFGVKLNNRCISMVCMGKQKHHRKFTFKYVKYIECPCCGQEIII